MPCATSIYKCPCGQTRALLVSWWPYVCLTCLLWIRLSLGLDASLVCLWRGAVCSRTGLLTLHSSRGLCSTVSLSLATPEGCVCVCVSTWEFRCLWVACKCPGACHVLLVAGAFALRPLRPPQLRTATSEPQFPHLCCGDNSDTRFVRLL